MPVFDDITGRTFNRLTVLRMAPRSGPLIRWECQCSCGNRSVVVGAKLRNGSTKSCGCYSRDVAASRFVDLSGRQYSEWTVIRRAPNKSDDTMFWCRCACGTERAVGGDRLVSGLSGSCGCLKSRRTTERQTVDLAGHRYGRLSVISLDGYVRNRAMWKCLCDCGKETVVAGNSLRTGNTKSCGCLVVELGRSKRTHGATRGRAGRPTGEYIVWAGMIQRCSNENEDCYYRYGGRGITVCERWRESFEAFLADMGPRPPGMTIERVDNDGNYEPGNCRWATQKEQQRNKRNSRFVEYNGCRLTVAGWAEALGVGHGSFASRIDNGWSDERALTQPFRRSAKHPAPRQIADIAKAIADRKVA